MTYYTNEYSEFMTLVLSMRRHQASYFQARKRHDEHTARKYLESSKVLEAQVDKHLSERMDQVKYGEQKVLFK